MMMQSDHVQTLLLAAILVHLVDKTRGGARPEVITMWHAARDLIQQAEAQADPLPPRDPPAP